MRIILASTNQGKVAELQHIFSEAKLDVQIAGLSSVATEPDEPFDSFMENAKHKAKFYAELYHQPCLSDDSGLCIESLNGFPGVRTKEFALECGSLQATYQKLSEMLSGKSNYNAYFICTIALYIPDQDKYFTSEGRVHGKLTFPPRGDKGFGFDPVFIPEGYDKTFAELGDQVKSAIGHRAKAVRGLLQQDFAGIL